MQAKMLGFSGRYSCGLGRIRQVVGHRPCHCPRDFFDAGLMYDWLALQEVNIETASAGL
jgi:hypothetical protein